MSNTESGREPVQLVEIDQDICVNVWGVSPCDAALSSAYPHKCFNTRKTCADVPNFDLAAMPLTLRFCKAQEFIPRDWGAIPCLVSVSTTPMRLNPGGASRNSKPLGARATVTIKMMDFPSSDLQVDPYQSERFNGDAQFSGVGYSPLDRGTFWSKWLRRNPYYNNFVIRVREGYIEDDPSEMITRTYIIQDIDGPDQGGNVTIKAQDIFALADDEKAKCPIQTEGVLDGALTDVAVTVPLVGWIAGEYPVAGTGRIGDEVFTWTGQNIVGDVLQLTGCTRGTDGTTAEAHDDGDSVQVCYRVADADDIYCWEVVYDLLVNYANVPAAYIPFVDWVTEGTTWLPTFTVTTLITEPTGVNQLIGELCEQCLFDIWWDEREQEIKFQALRAPTETPIPLNDRQNIIAGSWSTKSDMKQRASEVWVYYRPRDPTKSVDDKANYSRATIRVDPTLAGPEKYKERQIRVIYSRWLETAQQVLQVTVRYLQRFQDGAKFLKIRCDAKDREVWTGTIVEVTLHSMVDAVGLPETRRWQVISAEEVLPGEVVEYNLQNYLFAAARYGFYVDVINCRDAANQWTLSGGGVNEYWFDNSGGTLIAIPNGVYINEPTWMNSSTLGVVGALNAGEWGWGDNDALGYNTLYVRLAGGGDPDAQAAGYIMADHPAYGDIPDPDAIVGGAWYSDDDGLMSDLSPGWSYQ